jgi:predicted GNAT superfamily acetyltransferase
MPPRTASRSFIIRPLASHDELRRCLALQRETWGESFTEAVPPSILKISQRLGGVAAGAFDDRDELLGFVFGLTGVEGGRIVHWSDMLAVRPPARGLGVGTALKMWQREHALEVGASVIYWTFDPLVARNAYINLTKLGATVVEYVEDMYGESDSDLHRGLGTDRFVVAWPLDESPGQAELRRGDAARAESLRDGAPTINEIPNAAGEALPPPGGAVVAVAIPRDIHEVQERSIEEAGRWRRSTRSAFAAAMGAGFRVSAFDPPGPGGLARYLLTRDIAEEPAA